MSLAVVRGGLPVVFRQAISSAAPVQITWRAMLNFLVLRSDQAVNMFFNATDAANGANYVAIPASTAATPYGEWSGPAEVQSIWLQAVATTANIEVTGFQRLG